MRAWQAVAGILLLAPACIDILADGGPSARCREGADPFVVAQHHPGFTTFEYQLMFYTLDRDGRLTYFRAHEDQPEEGEGTGRVQVSGRLHNLTVDDVRSEMRRVGAYSERMDYNVSIAWRHSVSPSLFEDFCGVVLGDFYSYRARYEDDTIADCDGFTFEIATFKGTHTSYSYCATGPQEVREGFEAMREEAWERFGIRGL